jgi:hypothetical protein
MIYSGPSVSLFIVVLLYYHFPLSMDADLSFSYDKHVHAEWIVSINHEHVTQ